jgi:hypothetical protein
MFSSKKAVGEACVEIRDGVGNRERGTCDATQGFCCVDDGIGGCMFPPIGADAPPAQGICKAVSAEGESCSVSQDIQLCEPELRCDFSQNVCVLDPPLPPVKNGEACYDLQTFKAVGACADGYCDPSDGKCKPREPNGGACDYNDQCASLRCFVGSCIAFCD